MSMLRNSPLSSRLFTTKETREIDKAAIEQFGISGFTLMEIAALGAAQIIAEEESAPKTGLFFCGKGNNAGDALAAARYLAEQYQHQTKIIFLLGTENLSPDTRRNYEILQKLSETNPLIQFCDPWEESLNSVSDAGYIVDGIFGTGLKKETRSPVPEVIQQINRADKTVYSMDIPTGLDGSTGRTQGACIKASCTLTFGTNKFGFYLNGASQYTGKVRFIPLPFPQTLMQSRSHMIGKELFDQIPVLTRQARHKYENGVVHLLAGSEGLTGAAITAAKSALKHGAGAVFLYVPRKLLPIYEITLPLVIKIPVGDDSDTFYKSSHQTKILENLNRRPGVLVAGPGTGTHPETLECLAEVLNHHEHGALIDADALALFTGKSLDGIPHSHRWLLTPHPGEAQNYLGVRQKEDHQKTEAISRLARKLNTNILLKGNPVIYSDINNNSLITGYDNSMFNRAGFGDYLAGAISARYASHSSLAHAIISVLYGSFAEFKRLNSPANFNPSSLLKDEFNL